MVLRLQPASRAQLAATRRHLALERCRVVVQAAQASAPAQRPKQPAPTAWHAKRQLLQAIEGTERGGEATLRTRGEVEEAQVAVEAFAGPELDFELLPGKWRLEYTTAVDVVPLVRPPHSLSPLTPLSVGHIYQRFSSLEEGRAENIIEAIARLPPLEGTEVTLVVEAAYEPRTSRSIALAFKTASAGHVRLSPALQNTLASPLLPRGWWNLQALLWLRELSLSVPLRMRPPFFTSGSSSSSSGSRAGAVGSNYLLTYLDEDMLIGRAQGSGGTFIFTREVEEEEQLQQAEEELAAAAAGAGAAAAAWQQLDSEGEEQDLIL